MAFPITDCLNVENIDKECMLMSALAVKAIRIS